MKAFLLSTAALALVASVTPGIAQPPDQKISTVQRPGGFKAAPAKHKQKLMTAASAPLRLRGGAVSTGLGGFYDYQSNGASPGYLVVRRGSPDVVVSTFMNASDGTSVEAANGARRVGYAYSPDGGTTWTSTPSIFDLRLGFPYLRATASGRPYIAAHGDLGEGDRSFVFGSGEIGGINDYLPIGELPLETASGRVGGVAWPTFVVTRDGSKAVVIGSYSNDEDQPEAPLQVATIRLDDGSTAARWRDLTDSASSNTSGGRTVAAVSDGGRIGVAWYKYAIDSNDASWGVYYTQSDDDGATWSTPVAVLTGERIIGDFNINGDQDTLTAGGNLDLAFRGEEPQLVFTGGVNNLLQFANVLFWSPSTSLRIVAMSHQEPGLGAYSIPLEKRQQNMGSVAYPTIAVGDDGRHVAIAFSAVAQTVENGALASNAVSEDGFQYYRMWGVGSNDGGRNWGRPFIIQDFAEKATDSASIEYPSAPELVRMHNGSMELPLVFQAKRYPGMYIYIGSGDAQTEAGPLAEASQYFQRFVVTPSMFRATSSVDGASDASALSSALVPNRTSGAAALEVTLPRATALDVSLVDALGREVSRPLARTHAAAGTTRIAIDASALPAGIYHCVVRHDDGVLTEKLEVVR